MELFLDDVLIFKRNVQEDTEHGIESNTTIANQAATGGTGSGGTGGGEANFGQNIGTGGVGVYKDKSGIFLNFKNINAGSDKITITDDTDDDELDIDIDVSKILENPPTEDLATKAPTSEWVFDHKANAVADIKHLTNAQISALHAIVVAGDLNHNDLANIDADDIKHLTAAQVSALHAQAHVFAATGPHTGELPLTDLAAGSQGSIIKRGGADWEELGKGTENWVLKAGASDIAWGEIIDPDDFDEAWNGDDAKGATRDALYDVINPLIAGIVYAGTWNPTSPDGLFPNNLESDTNGSTAGTSVFTSAGKDFGVAGVVIGDILLIEDNDGGDAGYHVITAVGTTTLTCDASTFGTASNLTYQVFTVPTGGDYYITTADGVCFEQFYENGDWLIWNSTTIQWDRIRSWKGDNWVSVGPGDSIQTAINEVMGSGGGTVFLEAGTHGSGDSFPITINSAGNHLNLIGTGEGSLIDIGGNYEAFNITNAASVNFKDFKLDIIDLTTSQTAIEIIAVNNVTIDNVTIEGDGDNGTGVYTTGSRTIVRDCSILSMNTGIYTNGSRARVQGNYVYDCANTGILNGAGGVVIDNIVDNNNSGYGGQNKGIYVLNPDQVIIANNLVQNVGSASIQGQGIVLSGSVYSIVSNNVIDGSREGIRIDSNSHNVVVEGNTIMDATFNHGATNYGILIMGGSDYCTIMGNTLTNITNATGSAYGIRFQSGSDNCIIGLNTFNNVETPFSDAGSGNRLFGSDIAYASSWNGNLGTPTKNAVYDELNDNRYTKTDVYTKTEVNTLIAAIPGVIEPSKFLGTGGFINGVWFGAALTVAANDPDANVHASFFVKKGGDFKVLIAYTQGGNAGKTASGKISWSKDVDLGFISWDLGDQNWDLPLGALNILNIEIYGTPVTLANNTRLAVRWGKDDTAGDAGGLMIVYGMWLVRQ